MFDFLNKKWIHNLCWILFGIYILSMFIGPAIYGAHLSRSFLGMWNHVHSVWMAWQTFNAAMIALIASLIALNAARMKEMRSLEVNSRAARVMMVNSLSMLCRYLQSVSEYYISLLKESDCNDLRSNIEFDDSFLTNFESLIKYSDPEISKYISIIVGEIQVQRSRMNGFCPDAPGVGPYTVHALIGQVCFIYALVSNAFKYARFETNSYPQFPNKSFLISVINQLCLPDLADSEHYEEIKKSAGTIGFNQNYWNDDGTLKIPFI